MVRWGTRRAGAAATDYTYDRLDGWSNGKMADSPVVTVSGEMAWSSTIGTGVLRPKRTYSGWCFVHNSEGITWCGIDEKDVSR